MSNEKELTHIDLFSGIGGFTLAAEWAGFKTIVFCEKEKFCQKILQKRFRGVITDSKSSGFIREKQLENSSTSQQGQSSNDTFSENKIPIIPEIRDFDGTKYRGATLLTGGFPCQPFSVAGQRRGKEDDRYLWPEMLRVINETKPRWILAENVPGIFHMALDTVLADLEGQGYTTGTFIIPACGLNAPHRRNRIWIVAWNAEGNTSNSFKRIWERKESISRRNNSNAPDSESRRRRSILRQKWGEKEIRNTGINRDASDSTRNGLHNSRTKGWIQKESLNQQYSREALWDESWLEIATRFCRVDDGVSDRIHRLKALGNAIVPQIAYEILKNIAWIENERN